MVVSFYFFNGFYNSYVEVLVIVEDINDNLLVLVKEEYIILLSLYVKFGLLLNLYVSINLGCVIIEVVFV